MEKKHLEELLREVRSCSHCKQHLPHGPRPVVIAHPDARILIIGQAPGTKVHASGIPWDDASGKRLRLWTGLSNKEFYDPTKLAIMPMGFCYPGKGKSGDLPPRPECAPMWHEKILAHLPNVRLTLLIGQYEQQYYLLKDNYNLTQRVEYYFKNLDADSAIFPLPHPSPRNTLWLKRNPWFEKICVPILTTKIKNTLISPYIP